MSIDQNITTFYITTYKGKKMKFANDITELVGNTPLVKLQKVSELSGTIVLGKCEFMNPSHSVKDRIGTNMIKKALADGLINQQVETLELL